MFTRAETTLLTETLQKVAPATIGRQKSDTVNREKWLQKMEFLSSLAAYNNAAILLHDISVNRFIYMSDKTNMLGNYDPQDFLSEVGVDFSFSNIHAQQRSAALLIQLKIISYGFEHPHYCLNNVVGNMTFLYKRKGGGYFQILQRVMVVQTDTDGYPLLYLRYLSDISHLLKPCAGLLITSQDETLIWAYNTHKKCLEQINLLTAQEKKILSLLAQGKQSKEIGGILFTSPHTIDTHRRNLLKKTNCIDTTALITFAKMTGLI